MSLRAFHVFFIILSTFLTGSLALWQLEIFAGTKQLLALLWAVLGFFAAGGLAVYLMWFLKKTGKKDA